MRTEQWRIQAVRLAEAGVHRGLARRAADPTYNEETWRVTADELGTSHAAAVRIRIANDLEQSTLHCEATAEFPAGAIRRAQATRQIDVPIPERGDEL